MEFKKINGFEYLLVKGGAIIRTVEKIHDGEYDSRIGNLSATHVSVALVFVPGIICEADLNYDPKLLEED